MKGYALSTCKTVIIFLILTLIWVLATDYLLFRFWGDNLDVYFFLQSVKGVIFVIIAAAAVYLAIRRNNKYLKQGPDDLASGTAELHTVLEQIEHGIARFNKEGRFLYANPFFCQLTGYCLKEIIQQHYSFIIKPEDNVELDYWDMLLKQGKLSRMKNIACITTKSGEKLICNVSVNEVQNAALGFNYILTLENVTNSGEEKKKLEERLKRYNILSMATMEGLWDWNMLTGQLYYNSNIKRLFGFDDAELQKGYAWWESNIHPDDQEKVLNSMNAALQLTHLTNIKNEYRFACNDGSYKTINDCFSILRDAEGRPFRLIVSMHDVTEQRDLQKQVAEKEIIYRRQLARTVMDAQESERRKLAEELHDNVNQLLGVVKLYIEHSIANNEVRDSLLKKSNEYIDRVIEELRNLSKNLAPPLLAELGLRDSLMSIAEAITEVQPINIQVDVDQLHETTLTDSHKLMLYRIVQEQLNNIMKHANAKNVLVHAARKNNKVLLVITDDGTGADLAADNLQGMGLRNIRNRIELYHGKTNFQTSPGKGFVLNVEFEI